MLSKAKYFDRIEKKAYVSFMRKHDQMNEALLTCAKFQSLFNNEKYKVSFASPWGILTRLRKLAGEKMI